MCMALDVELDVLGSCNVAEFDSVFEFQLQDVVLGLIVFLLPPLA